MRGIFTPFEFFELGLTRTEMDILAIYKYYTVEGDLKCCTYTNQRIADMIKVNVQTVKAAKKRLRELDYIRTDGGIRTYYTGIAEGKNTTVGGCETQPVGDVKYNRVGMENTTGGGCETQPLGGCEIQPHNKEEKRIKKRNNKEIIKNKKRVNKEEMKSELKEKQTILDRVLDLLNQDTDTKEHIPYILENCNDLIDEVKRKDELVKEGVIPEDKITEDYLKQDIVRKFRDRLNQKDMIKYNKVLPKEKKEVNYIDLF